MFCRNCGMPIPEDSKVCATCGAQVETGDSAPVETPVAETQVLTSEGQPVFAQPYFETPDVVPPKKKRKKPLLWLIPVVAVVVAIAVLAAVVLGPLQGWWLKSFGSEMDYREYVHENSTPATNVLSEAYGSVLTSLSSTSQLKAADLSVKLNIGDKAITLLEDLVKDELGQKLEMDWAKSIELKLSANPTEKLQQIGATLNINSQEIAVLDCILNTDNGKLFATLVNLNAKYLQADISSYLPEVDDSSAATMAMLQDPALIKALPSEKELDSLVSKYTALVMDNLDDVSKSTETVEAGALSQELTTLNTTIKYDDILDASEDVLEALLEDQQIESIIRRVANYLQTQKSLDLDVDADKAYKAFQDAIQDTLDELDSAKAEEQDPDTSIVLTEYISKEHKVIGYALTVNGVKEFYCVELQDGNAIAYALDVSNAVSVVGEGTKKNGAITADYTVTVNALADQKMDVLTISLVDFKAEDNALNGKVLLAPTSDMLKNMGLSSTVSSAINLADPKLELDFASSKDSSSIEINLLSGEDLLVGLALSGTEKAATPITEPTNTCDLEDIEDWLEGVDTNKLMKALKDADLPVEEFLGALMF